MSPNPHPTASPDPREPTTPHPSPAVQVRPGLPRRLAPVLGLLLLAPISAEILIGYDDTTGDPVALLASMLVFIPLYGAAALLIREVARRAGRGWPTIILLATAFGVLQPGLIDQAMFNPSYRDIDYLQPIMEPTYLPALGLSAYLTLTWVTGHVIFSVGAPIAIVETFVPNRRTTPWLGGFGLAVTTVVFLLAAVVVIRWHLRTEQFVPSVPQLLGAAAVVVTLVVAGFVVGRRPHSLVDRAAPSPWLVGAATLGTLFLPTVVAVVVHVVGADPLLVVDWRGVGVHLAHLATLLALLALWSRRRGWGAAHRLAVAGAALLHNALIAFTVDPIGDVAPVAKLGHNTVLAIGVLVLVAVAARRVSTGLASQHVRMEI